MSKTSTKTWPYDADQHDPLTTHRIPVTSDYPEWGYIMAFSNESDARPTDAEVRMLVSFLNSIKNRYNCYPDDRPLDTDAGANTVTFKKHGENDWTFKCRTWEHGFRPIHWQNGIAPAGYEPFVPRSLEYIMDYSNNMGTNDDGSMYIMKSWLEWKTEHPEAFPSNTVA
jgi:hypothetical protein